MILQYFKKKENEYKIKSDEIYLNVLYKSKLLLNKKYFDEIDFGISFELISILLIFYLKILKDRGIDSDKIVNEELLAYLNSLKFVNKNNSNELADVLSKFFMEIKNNND